MGHITSKSLYRKLGKKIDGLQVKAPWNEAFYEILKELYTPAEAEILIAMPYGLSTFKRIAKITKCEEKRLRGVLDSLCTKGLVFDLCLDDTFYYTPSPLVIGIFEMTMMRVGENLNSKKWAKLFHEYMQGDDRFYAANFKHGEKTSVIRALPHEEAVDDSPFVEILDYEKASSIVEASDRWAIGLCSCRHEKHHLGEKTCDVPLRKCSSFGTAADYLIRHNMAEEVSKEKMLENLEHSREHRLVLSADNVQKNVTFICHCCKCCCNVLLGVSRHGYPNTLVTSSFISEIDESKCTGCEKCAKDCPISAIEMVAIQNPKTKKLKNPKVDKSICLGCGVCALRCHKDAVKLVKRSQRVLHPETTFERVILQSLERGTLQNQIFDNPQSVSQKVLRGIVGGFLKLPPVKKTLMSDALRSSFLTAMKKGTESQRKGWLLEM
ncbi:MAG: ATP-binding protein [bacterium]